MGAFKIHSGDYVFWIFFIFRKKYEFWRRAKALEISRFAKRPLFHLAGIAVAAKNPVFYLYSGKS